MNNLKRSSSSSKQINYKNKIVDELYKPARKNFPRRRVIQKGIGDTLQADLIIFDDYVKENKGFRYLLTVIDIFSKKAWAAPLKTKTGLEVTKAFEKILNKIRYKIKNLQTDQGKEFFNKHFQLLMKQHNINHYNTWSHLKASIVERYQKTFKMKLYKDFAYRGSYDWVNNYQRITNIYNKTPHSGIGGMKPNEVTKAKEKALLDTVYNHPKLYIKPKYKVGEFVRLSKYRKVFDKGYHANYTTEIFKIVKAHITMPPTYSLVDLSNEPIQGKFYEQEIQKTTNSEHYLVEKILKQGMEKRMLNGLDLKNQLGFLYQIFCNFINIDDYNI